jgi:hypothetical protein
LSKQLGARTEFLPPPLSGINLVASPFQLADDEARDLRNYYIFNSGIRQIPAPVAGAVGISGTGAAQCMIPYDAGMILATMDNIYRISSPGDLTLDNLTGALVFSATAWTGNYFNKRIFLWSGDSTTPLVYDVVAGTLAAFSSSASAPDNLLSQATSYNHRLYAVELGTTNVWYGGVDAIGGTFTELNLGPVFQEGAPLLFCFNWTFNQGNENQEFIVFVSSVGEALVYGGLHPGDADTWRLIARTRLPTPLSKRAWLSVAGKVYVGTVGGYYDFASFVAGLNTTGLPTVISQNLKGEAGFDPAAPCAETTRPFFYAIIGNGLIAILNYERGAWSFLDVSTSFVGTLSSIAVFQNTLVMCDRTGHLFYIPVGDGQSASSLLNYKWATPFKSFGSANQKHVKGVRVVGRNRNPSLASKFANSVSVSTDLNDPASPQSDSKETDVTNSSRYVTQELSPPGCGSTISLVFSRAGLDAQNQQNEIQGVYIDLEDGGRY